jgi:hypothetical protein
LHPVSVRYRTARIHGVHARGRKWRCIPCSRRCYSSDTFQATEEIERLSDQLDKQVEARQELLCQKAREYNSFLFACRYLEEVEAVVPLTEEIRKEIGGQTRTLSVINPDVLYRIAEDFKEAA